MQNKGPQLRHGSEVAQPFLGVKFGKLIVGNFVVEMLKDKVCQVVKTSEGIYILDHIRWPSAKLKNLK